MVFCSQSITFRVKAEPCAKLFVSVLLRLQLDFYCSLHKLLIFHVLVRILLSSGHIVSSSQTTDAGGPSVKLLLPNSTSCEALDVCP